MWSKLGGGDEQGGTAYEWEAESKIGKHKSMRQTLLTAEERGALIEKSMAEEGGEEGHGRRRGGMGGPRRQGSAPLDKVSWAERQDKMKHKAFQPKATAYTPALSGAVQGSRWNRLIRETWGEDPTPYVYHTMIMPEGKKPKDVKFWRATIKSSNTRILEPGEIPDTMSNPCPQFDAFVEPTVVVPGIPNHFLVVGSIPCEPITYNHE